MLNDNPINMLAKDFDVNVMINLVLVGKRGVEPLLQEPESCVLPLDDFPIMLKKDLKIISQESEGAIK